MKLLGALTYAAIVFLSCATLFIVFFLEIEAKDALPKRECVKWEVVKEGRGIVAQPHLVECAK